MNNIINTNSKFGFTIIELLIVIVIVSILAAFATTSYNSHLVKAKRAEAQTGLINLIAQAEQYYLKRNNSYPANVSSLKIPTIEYYSFTGDQSCGADCFKVTATATGAQLAADRDCSPLTLDTRGVRGPNMASCWNR